MRDGWIKLGDAAHQALIRVYLAMHAEMQQKPPQKGGFLSNEALLLGDRPK